MEPAQERKPEDAAVIELMPGHVTTGEWIASRGHLAVFACEVPTQHGGSDTQIEIRAETKDADQPEAAATEILPLRLDRGRWQVRGPGIHYAEFVRPRSLLRFRYCVLPAAGETSPPGPIGVRMLPALWRQLPDGLEWISPWIPFAPEHRRSQLSVGRVDGPGISVEFSAVQSTEDL
jgi:hypothetical protein